MNIPEKIKELFQQTSIEKNMRIHFPNGERSDICSDNIVEESAVLEQSICSEDELKFGLCEASRFECTVECIEENGERGNIKDCKIQVYIEIDVSSLTEEEIAEYGQTSEDVPFPYYRVPMFTGTVSSCKKQSNMDMRKIIAYDDINSDRFDVSLMPWIRYVTEMNSAYSEDTEENSTSSGNIIVYPTTTTKVVVPLLEKSCDVLASMLAYNDLVSDMFGKEVNVGEIIQYSEEEIEGYSGLPYKADEQKVLANVGTGLFKQTVTLYSYWVGTQQEITVPKGLYLVKVEYDREVLAKINRIINSYAGTNDSVNELIGYFKTFPVALGKWGIGTASGITTATVTKWQKFTTNEEIPSDIIVEITEDITAYLAYPGSVIIDDGSSLIEGTYFYGEETKYNIVKSIRLLPVNEETRNRLDLGIKLDFGYDSESDTAIIEERNFTLRNIVGGFLELFCAFGKVSPTGELEIRALQKPYWELSERWALSDSWILNYSEDSRIPAGEEEEGWYDEDYEDSLYGAVKLLGENNTIVAEYVGNTEGLKSYEITDNIILSSCISDKWVIHDILKGMYEKIQAYRNTPMQIRCVHSPHRETGDKIILNDNGKEVATYIFNKVTTGIGSLSDEIDTTNMAQ